MKSHHKCWEADETEYKIAETEFSKLAASSSILSIYAPTCEYNDCDIAFLLSRTPKLGWVYDCYCNLVSSISQLCVSKGRVWLIQENSPELGTQVFVHVTWASLSITRGPVKTLHRNWRVYILLSVWISTLPFFPSCPIDSGDKMGHHLSGSIAATLLTNLLTNWEKVLM